MKKKLLSFLLANRAILLLTFLMIGFFGNSQTMQVNILGGAVVTSGGTLTINSGNSLTFQITNIETGNCSSVRVQSITTNNPNFSVLPSNANENIKPSNCNGTNFLNFTVTRGDSACTTENAIITIFSNEGYFTFTLIVNRAPIISILGGNPLADVVDGSTATTATNGTYFGIVESDLTQTRRFYIANTGSCPLTISSITSSLSDFTIATPVGAIPPASYNIASGASFYFDVTFLAPAIAGTYLSTITVENTTGGDSNLYTFNVRAEVFDFTGPGPGGITTDFRLWLKATRGINPAISNSKVSVWKDLGTNPKDAIQGSPNLQPTYLDDVDLNINFNPVVKFENDGATEQYLYNEINGFYSQDIFIVMIPDNTIESTSSRNTIFAGVSKKAIDDITYDPDDITGIGFGDYTTTSFTDELLTYSQNTEASFNGIAEISTIKSYSNAGIINVRNDAEPVVAQELLYNSKLLSTSLVNDITFENVGYVEESLYQGTPYWIGRNYGIQGSLNGRVAEIMTFAQRVPDTDRPKIETYLAIKYGITLGATEAEKDYVNSAGTVIWDFTANAGFDFNIAGIGKDDSSDLNQKQSKSINDPNEVTIGLGVISATNSANINEFNKDGDFLVWGCDNDALTGVSTNTITISTGVTTSLTRIARKWKIVESKEALDGDVENVFVGIPTTAFSGFSKLDSEEYVLIVSDNEDLDEEYFEDDDIVDVIPLKLAGSIYQTWYDFDGTKYFTFGKAPKLTEKSAVNITAGDYLVGEYALNLNINAFTISAWVRGVTPSANPRTIMAKGTKLQLRLNSANNIEVMVDNDITPRFTSNMILNDGKWHNVTFVYASGTVFLYIDGILDKSEQGVNPPTPNYNRFSIGAVYVSKNEIINPFLGEIEEVYVWDQGLSQNQIRYLMNQEVEKVTGDLVNGKALPQTSPSNEITNIPWSTLRAYYDFNTFYGTTVEGLTDERNFLRIKYLDKTKTIAGTQTAPLPYVSAAPGGVWDNAATWVNSNVQNLPNTIGLDGTTTVDWNIVETSHDIISGDRDITVLGLISTAGELTLADPAITSPVENNDGQGLRVTHYLELDGSIDLVGESQLVQDEGSVLDQDSGGFIERDQQGTANSFNYNYWSSSVGPITASGVSTRGTGIPNTNANASISGVLLDGRDSDTPLGITYNSSPYAADSGSGASLTISSYWLYKFNGLHGDYNSWFPRIDENSPLEPGVGYTVKGSLGAVAITTNQNYVFKGKPYNGDISLIIAAGNDRLIGNPYPSALDADEFILDNIKTTETIINFNSEEEIGRNEDNVFNGALYFWHHFGEENSHYLKEYVGGYATYTLIGGVEAYSTSPLINNSTPLVGGGKVPERYIPVGQGFFVNATLPSGISGTTATVEGGTILFKNSQRVFERENSTSTNEGSVFFKTNSVSKTKIKKAKTDSRAKIRLQFSSPKGYIRQLLVGIAENATNHFDIGYDAPIADVNKDDVFWTFDNAKFVIQAVNNFNTDQELPMGVKIAKAGLATIKIDQLENLDENISLHIKDKLTGETHNISQKTFEINLESGTYLDRFSLIFKMQKLLDEDVNTEIFLAEESPLIIEGVHIFMDNDIGELQIKNNNGEEITNIILYNNLGQVIKTWNTNLNRWTISLPISIVAGVYIVQINTKNGSMADKIIVE
jgi:hypothetical protein